MQKTYLVLLISKNLHKNIYKECINYRDAISQPVVRSSFNLNNLFNYAYFNYNYRNREYAYMSMCYHG